MTLLGALLNLLIVFGPPLLVRRDSRVLTDPVVLLVATMITLFYFAELPRRRIQPVARRSRSSVLQIAFHREATRRSKIDVVGFWLAVASCMALLGVFWIGLADYLRTENVAPIWRMHLSATVMLLGIALRHLAIRTLDHGFVTQPTPVSGRPLVVSGIYAWVRHPSEAGLMCLVFGVVGLLESYWGAVATLASLVPLTLARLHIEEQALLATFGSRYESYQRTIGRFIPSVHSAMLLSRLHSLMLRILNVPLRCPPSAVSYLRCSVCVDFELATKEKNTAEERAPQRDNPTMIKYRNTKIYTSVYGHTGFRKSIS